MDPTWIIINTIDDPIPANAPALLYARYLVIVWWVFSFNIHSLELQNSYRGSPRLLSPEWFQTPSINS